MCDGFDPSDYSLLPPIYVRVVSRWLSIAMSLTVWGCQVFYTVPAIRQVIPRGNPVGWSHVHIVSQSGSSK